MKSLNLFEIGIVSFLFGVVASIYNIFIIGTDNVMGKVLSFISLKDVLDGFAAPDTLILIASLGFYLLVYTVYGIIFLLIVKLIKKSEYVLFPLLFILIIVIGYQQFAIKPVTKDEDLFVSSPVVKKPVTPKQYYGTEARGDLNSDGKDDVAFILKRIDKERGNLFYLSTAIADDNGYNGKDLMFLGNKIEPKTIGIDNGVIRIEYIDHNDKSSTTTQITNVKLINEELKVVESATSTESVGA